ncbi:hypothetical protein JTB14_004873 [Gonioctena quinquepunctata]|nr:hypothetical protein JTB14_029711 [Gonioctena quinquepunctata]KAG5892676.1 hypothetical protein JTB14_004873 [Gonioctena quinquepunctata]
MGQVVVDGHPGIQESLVAFEDYRVPRDHDYFFEISGNGGGEVNTIDDVPVENDLPLELSLESKVEKQWLSSPEFKGWKKLYLL